MLRRIRAKIIFSFLVLMVAGGAVSTTLVSRNMSRSLSAAVDRGGQALARVLAEQLAEPLAYGDRLATRRLLTGAHEANPEVVYAFVSAPDGSLVAHSFPLGGFPADLVAVASEGRPLTLATETGTVRHVVQPVTEGVLGTLHLGMSMTWVDEATAAAVGNVLFTTVLAMAVGVLGILFLANLITRPLISLRDAAVRLGAGDADVEAPEAGAEEVADLARTFNQMAAQIRQRIAETEGLRDYVARVLDQMGSGITVVSGAYEVEYANRVAREDHGVEVGRTCWEVLGGERPCDACPLEDVLSSRSVVERRFTSDSGRVYELKWVPVTGLNGRPAMVERALEVTQQVHLQERFQRAQRLAVAGSISAGIVHSVNNPLDGVRRALELAEAHADDPERVARMLALAREGTDRIAGITRSLLSFARGRSAPDPVPTPVDALVDAALSLTRLRAESRGVEVRARVEPNLEPVAMDPQGMEEVLVNLVLNAVDACGAGGTVTVSASDADGRLVLAVDDTGPGIPPALAEDVFEPFFTTKEGGEGTGLGLSVARRIVEDHGGTLDLEAAPSGGARFVITLPHPTVAAREAS